MLPQPHPSQFQGGAVFGGVTKRERTLEQRRKDAHGGTVKSMAISVAREIIGLKGQITLKEMEKKARKIRAKIPKQYQTLFDDTLAFELKDFLCEYFTT